MPIDIRPLIKEMSKGQLIEIDACVHCSECVSWCPVTSVEEDYDNTPMDKIALLKSILQRSSGPLKFLRVGVKDEELRKLADEVYRCSTCGRCGVVCPVGINCQELWPSVRGGLVSMGYGPLEKITESQEILEKVHNPFNFSMNERNDWMEGFKPKDRAELAFFVGCELAYRVTPMALGALKLFTAGSADFTMSEDEWCCGYPLYVLGNRSDEIRLEIEHNIEVLKERGVKRVAASCPCCYGMLKNKWREYHESDLPFEIVHVLNITNELLEKGKLRFTKAYEGGPVAYHDPCYLSRGWGEGEGVIEEPRNLLNAIDGIELIELPDNKRMSRCPGSGGGIRRACPELSEKMAQAFVDEVKNTGVELLLTSCPAVYERVTHIINLNNDHVIEEKAPWGVDEDKNNETLSKSLKVMDIMDFASRYI